MSELWLFIIVGALAVAGAVLMLLSDNAVHSALFLIVTMVSIAFLFLMLNSPFLAMIQITVYAGAIMVLFLFVIMLLGAERVKSADPGPERHRYRWFTPVALTLALALLFSIGLVTIQGNLDSEPVPLPDPLVRAVNTGNDGPIDVYVGSQLIADDLAFGQASDFVSVPEGEYGVSVRPASGGEVVGTLAAVNGGATNVLAYGRAGELTLSLLPQDVQMVLPDGYARVQIFNAFPDSDVMSVVEAASLDTNAAVYRSVVAENIPYGQSQTTELENGTLFWRFLAGLNGATPITELQDYDLGTNRTNLLVVTRFDGDLAARNLPVMLESRAEPVFGSPSAIGYSLFTQFLLPFQMLGLLLLAAMVGVIALTHRQMKPIGRAQGRRKVSQPLTAVIASQVGHDVVDETGTPQLPEPPASEPEAQPEPAS